MNISKDHDLFYKGVERIICLIEAKYMTFSKENLRTLLPPINGLSQTVQAFFPPQTMTTDITAPATKADISAILKLLGEMQAAMATKSELSDFREETNARFNRMEERHYAFEIKVENRFEEMVEKWREEMNAWKEEIKFHFDVTVENISHNLKSANREEIEVIKDNIVRLKRHTRLPA